MIDLKEKYIYIGNMWRFEKNLIDLCTDRARAEKPVKVVKHFHIYNRLCNIFLSIFLLWFPPLMKKCRSVSNNFWMQSLLNINMNMICVKDLSHKGPTCVLNVKLNIRVKIRYTMSMKCITIFCIKPFYKNVLVSRAILLYFFFLLKKKLIF